MKKEDIIYKDKNYTILKKDAGALGTFAPLDCLELIDIATEELAKWNNAGLKDKNDYMNIIKLTCEKLINTIK